MLNSQRRDWSSIKSPVTAILSLVCLAFATAAMPAAAQEQKQQGGGSLAEAAQNPIAAMISLPFQNNTYFDIGPDDVTANTTLIQPVVPVSLGEDWNLIARAIVPLVYVEGFHESDPFIPNATIDMDDTFGLGDINLSGYFSPKVPTDLGGGKLVWGAGPSMNFNTSTDDEIGSEKWSAGPAAVAVYLNKPWVVGSLFRQLWSFAGNDDRDEVNQFLMQPFVNFNLPDQWYLVSSPVITANWTSTASERWTVPVGGGFGKIFKIGGQAINAQTQAFWYAEAPKNGPDWAMRFQLTFLFPE